MSAQGKISAGIIEKVIEGINNSIPKKTNTALL